MTVETLYPDAPSAQNLEQQYSLRRRSMIALLLPIYQRAYRWTLLVFGDSNIALEIATETATQVIRFGEDALDLPCFLEWSSLYLARAIEEKAAKIHQTAILNSVPPQSELPQSMGALVENRLRQLPMELRLALILNAVESHSLGKIGRLLRRSKAIIAMRIDEAFTTLQQSLREAKLVLSTEALRTQLTQIAETELLPPNPNFDSFFQKAGWR
ncbi:MAG: hypothetical protein P1V97_28645 [Planctomycetota bacterium]|nr:hypothetical protein [Planctomycetota bacterium]